MTDAVQSLTVKQKSGKATVLKPSVRVKDINLRVPDDGYEYVQILHDYQYLGYPRQKDDGVKYAIPAMVNEVKLRDPGGRAYDYVDFSETWQRFLFDLWKWSIDGLIPLGKWEGQYKNASNPDITFDKYTDGSMLWYYTNMIQDARSHTDSRAPETGGQDYVTGRNPGRPPYQWLCKTTTGNILRVKRRLSTEIEVYALDVLQPPPKIYDIQNSPHLIHWATEQTMVRYANKTWGVSRYPQANIVCRLAGFRDTGTPIPNVSLGGSYKILTARTRPLIAGQVYSPYNPGK